jgi:hypothetical protein
MQENKHDQQSSEQGESPSLVELKIQIPSELYIAYQRCSWIIVHETGRKPLEVMEEMVGDFLTKHGC